MVADIHFDYKIALAALRAGADKIRINPGNIGESWKVEEVARACKAAGVPIRIGVNGGSLEKGIFNKANFLRFAFASDYDLVFFCVTPTVKGLHTPDANPQPMARRLILS